MFSLFYTSKFSPVWIIFRNDLAHVFILKYQKLSSDRVLLSTTIQPTLVYFLGCHSFGTTAQTLIFNGFPLSHRQVDFKRGLVLLSNTNKGLCKWSETCFYSKILTMKVVSFMQSCPQCHREMCRCLSRCHLEVCRCHRRCYPEVCRCHPRCHLEMCGCHPHHSHPSGWHLDNICMTCVILSQLLQDFTLWYVD